MTDNNRSSLRTYTPSVPTFARYQYLAKQVRRYSLTRALQYEALANYVLNGDVLDFGGGEKSLYRNLLRCTSYSSINIDPQIEPTWLVSVGSPLPCANDSFDTVLSLNTLEHVFEAQSVLSELHRVLRPGGELVLSVPFLFPVHGHPDDFFRPTPSWYRRALGTCGFSEVDVIPLAWGPFSTASVCSGTPGPAKGARKQWGLLLDLVYAQIVRRRQPLVDVHAQLERYATAFFVRAIK